MVTRPGAGTVGKAVEILGTNLRGTTNVSFNGTAAAFEVVSDTLIATTVPVGASTGTVQVVTPGGTLSSTHRSGCGHKGYVGLRRPSLGIQRVAQPVAPRAGPACARPFRRRAPVCSRHTHFGILRVDILPESMHTQARCRQEKNRNTWRCSKARSIC